MLNSGPTMVSRPHPTAPSSSVAQTVAPPRAALPALNAAPSTIHRQLASTTGPNETHSACQGSVAAQRPMSLSRQPTFYELPSAMTGTSSFSRLPLSSDPGPMDVDTSSDTPLALMTARPFKASQISHGMGPPTFIPPPKDPHLVHEDSPSFQYTTAYQQRPPSQLPASSPLASSDHPSAYRNDDHASSSQWSSSQQQKQQHLSSSPVDAMLSSLREETGLYDMPNEDLQQLVAQIVCEPGFAPLVSCSPEPKACY